MTEKRIHQILTCFIASVWFINGLVCKVLNLVPRHEQIVERITGYQHPRLLTLLIGISEIVMAVWIVSGIWKRFNAVTQILVIASMNLLELFLAADLLLWGSANALFAFLFISLIYYNTFYLNQKVALQS